MISAASWIMHRNSTLKFGGCATRSSSSVFHVRPTTKRHIHNTTPNSSVFTRNHYDTLGVSRNSDKKQIRDSYIRLSKQLHPDRQTKGVDTHDKFVELQRAYEVLSKSSSRHAYDSSLGSYGTYRPRRNTGDWDFWQGYDNHGFSNEHAHYWQRCHNANYYQSAQGGRIYSFFQYLDSLNENDRRITIFAVASAIGCFLLTVMWITLALTHNRMRDHDALSERYLQELIRRRERRSLHRSGMTPFERAAHEHERRRDEQETTAARRSRAGAAWTMSNGNDERYVISDGTTPRPKTTRWPYDLAPVFADASRLQPFDRPLAE